MNFESSSFTVFGLLLDAFWIALLTDGYSDHVKTVCGPLYSAVNDVLTLL